ncbi:hypothetical protein ASD11_01270 [Aeromicrobium sp. Root495]|uniref:hypothetical protein n=1 Tax=Aeromicrobium sp. Root495 TaxID=1736550 RepID=UPI0006F71CF0|nr:hypothetical protein [Aeromicrobium sp. Root495]KQY58325.1 hypothetical protein ASD11_01270 [Aeromicrobium sp. Root495]
MAAKGSKPGVVVPTGGPSSEWTVGQLRAWAKFFHLDLGSARRKPEILERVLASIDPNVEPAEPTPLLDATERSIAKAIADQVLDAELHAGPIETLRILARKIDEEDQRWRYAIEYARENDIKAKPPPVDNVSIPTYRNYCESLGLTVAGAKAAPAKGGAAGGEPKKSKLGQLRSVHAGEGA